MSSLDERIHIPFFLTGANCCALLLKVIQGCGGIWLTILETNLIAELL